MVDFETSKYQVFLVSNSAVIVILSRTISHEIPDSLE